MKINRVIEGLALDMGRSEKQMPEKCDVISDEIILKKLEQIEDIEQTDRDGRTLLITAVFSERKKVVEYLLKREANIKTKDKTGYTVLHAAVQVGDIDIIKILLENGADIHARDAYGNPPILRTNLLTSKEVFKLLLTYGADPNEKNDFGMSAMDVFAAYPEILSILSGNVCIQP